jgi:heme/copper-type cytochrome/quinol oxidase subunit 2
MKILINIWYWIVGYPAELTYWFEGSETTLKVRKFNEIKPNHITFKNMETEKYVVVKSDQPIKYIIREE